jgi:hypothetical protein
MKSPQLANLNPVADDAEAASEALDPAISLVLTRIRLLARRRIDWLRAVWSDESAGNSGSTITHAEVDLHLDDRDSPTLEAAWLKAHPAAGQTMPLRLVEAAMAADHDSRLGRLVKVFGLGTLEQDILQTCLAASVDESLPRVYAYLQDHAGRSGVTDALVARLFGHGRTLLLPADAPLLRWSLVLAIEGAQGEPRSFVIDPDIRDWLLGGDAADRELIAISRIHPEGDALPEWPLAQTVAELRRWLGGSHLTPVRLRIVGTPGSGRRSFASAVAWQFQLPLLVIDTRCIDAASWPRIYVLAQRHAFLNAYAPAFVGEWPYTNRCPEAPAHFPVQFVLGETARPAPLPPQAIDHVVQLPPLTLASRRRLVEQHLPWSREWADEARDTFVTQHRASPGDIQRIAVRGPDSAAQATALLRESAREQLGELALRLECPFGRADLVLPATLELTLDELVFEAQERVAFWERPEAIRLFPQGRGLLALLCGPPGTGKTMTAQVVAAELGMDLFRVDLAAVVSKWVGETSRNLDRLLSRAAQLDVVLLFDEADALFGKRTEVKEANDRFANTDTGYLLQAIESYPGIAILSTNRKGDIDPAFMRRLRFLLDYPMPDSAERLRLWQNLIGELAGAGRRDALQTDLSRLAEAAEVSGAQIKYAVLNAVFSARREARPIAAGHLLRGLQRELAKEGRPLGDRLRERMVADHAG